MEETNKAGIVGETPSAKKSKKGVIIIILLMIAILVVPKLLGSGKKTVIVTPSSTTPQVQVPVMADVVNGEIIVEAGSYYFKPNIVRVKKGEKIKLTFNAVSMMHDFNIDELGIKVPVTKAGTSSTVEFTVDQMGEFEFYCSVGQHRQMGQVGKLIVVE